MTAELLVQGRMVDGIFVPDAIYLITGTLETQEAVLDFLQTRELSGARTGRGR